MSGYSRKELLHPTASHAVGHNGMVRLSIWREDQPNDEPERVWMTPGQALQIIQSLSAATQQALKDMAK